MSDKDPSPPTDRDDEEYSRSKDEEQPPAQTIVQQEAQGGYSSETEVLEIQDMADKFAADLQPSEDQLMTAVETEDGEMLIPEEEEVTEQDFVQQMEETVEDLMRLGKGWTLREVKLDEIRSNAGSEGVPGGEGAQYMLDALGEWIQYNEKGSKKHRFKQNLNTLKTQYTAWTEHKKAIKNHQTVPGTDTETQEYAEALVEANQNAEHTAVPETQSDNPDDILNSALSDADKRIRQSQGEEIGEEQDESTESDDSTSSAEVEESA